MAVAPTPAPATPAGGLDLSQFGISQAPGAASTPAPPVGLVSQDGGAAGVNPLDTSQAPASVGEGVDWFGATKEVGTLIKRFSANISASSSDAMDIGNISGGPSAWTSQSPMLSPQAANEKYGQDGLKFSSPVQEDVAASMAQDHQEAALRADAANRQAPGIIPGVERAATEFAAQTLDPTNIAAMFVPALGEARIGAAAADIFGTGLAGRTAARVGVGAVQGAISQVPLTGAQALLAHQDQDDFTMTDALSQVLAGAVFGGAAHAGLGAIGEALGHEDAITQVFRNSPHGKIVAADPLTRRTAATAAIAAAADGRTDLGVQPLIELSAREQQQSLALRSLQYDNTAPVSARLHALEDDLTRPGVPEAVLPNLQEQHGQLQQIQEAHADINQAQAFQPGADPATQARLDAIDAELKGPQITANRVTALYQERRMLTEGGAPVDATLDTARTQAIVDGNNAAIARNNAHIAELQDQIRQSSAAREAATGVDPAVTSRLQRLDKQVQTIKPETFQAPPRPEAEQAVDARLDQMRQRGELSPDDEDWLNQINGQDEHVEAEAKAREAFGVCMGGLA